MVQSEICRKKVLPLVWNFWVLLFDNLHISVLTKSSYSQKTRDLSIFGIVSNAISEIASNKHATLFFHIQHFGSRGKT